MVHRGDRLHARRSYGGTQGAQAGEQEQAIKRQLSHLSRYMELDDFERQLVAHEEEVKEVRKKQAEWELELEHFQKQKSSVTNEREFTAVISEIDYATKAIEETSARRKELEEAI